MYTVWFHYSYLFVWYHNTAKVIICYRFLFQANVCEQQKWISVYCANKRSININVQLYTVWPFQRSNPHVSHATSQIFKFVRNKFASRIIPNGHFGPKTPQYIRNETTDCASASPNVYWSFENLLKLLLLIVLNLLIATDYWFSSWYSSVNESNE